MRRGRSSSCRQPRRSTRGQCEAQTVHLAALAGRAAARGDCLHGVVRMGNPQLTTDSPVREHLATIGLSGAPTVLGQPRGGTSVPRHPSCVAAAAVIRARSVRRLVDPKSAKGGGCARSGRSVPPGVEHLCFRQPTTAKPVAAPIRCPWSPRQSCGGSGYSWTVGLRCTRVQERCLRLRGIVNIPCGRPKLANVEFSPVKLLKSFPTLVWANGSQRPLEHPSTELT